MSRITVQLIEIAQVSFAFPKFLIFLFSFSENSLLFTVNVIMLHVKNCILCLTLHFS